MFVQKGGGGGIKGQNKTQGGPVSSHTRLMRAFKWPNRLMLQGANDRACSADSVLSKLLAGFSRDADYWTGHEYFDADTPFHSYFNPKLVGPPLHL